jgi:hypothetical protein
MGKKRQDNFFALALIRIALGALVVGVVIKWGIPMLLETLQKTVSARVEKVPPR